MRVCVCVCIFKAYEIKKHSTASDHNFYSNKTNIQFCFTFFVLILSLMCTVVYILEINIQRKKIYTKNKQGPRDENNKHGACAE
jgi:hypothetical protein